MPRPALQHALRCLVLTAVLGAATAPADDSVAAGVDPDAILAAALTAFEEDYRERWSYDESLINDGKTFVGHYDPRQPLDDRWHLISIDGQTPTEDASEDYLDEKREREMTQRETDSNRRDPGAMVTKGTLSLLAETAQHWQFGFTPAGRGRDEKIMRKLKGEMRIMKSPLRIQYIRTYSESPFKPQFGVKVNTFKMHFEFARVDGGPVLPASFDFTIDLKAIGIISVDQTVSATYSDYREVARPPGSP
jgi:hypothetical protein